MALTTCNVLCTVHDDAGVPVQGATVSAKLNQFEVYNGYVVPTLIEGTTNANGQVTLALWPNQLGSTESMYTVKISAPNGKRLSVNAVVPNVSNTELHLIAELPPYDGKTDGQLILDAAVAAGALAVSKAAEASASASAAASSATSASGSATTALGAATTATTKASEAASSAANAATSATNAANSVASIGDSATTAQNAATAAAASATSATTKASEAATSATNAAASATTASTAATTATTKASEAGASAATASTAATNASNSASAASTLASNAANSASAASTSATAASASATAASASASSATTKASEAAVSASTASTAATNASSSASTAASAATTAATQATAAGSSATNAATSATNAATSATSAGTSATAAAASATTASGAATTATTKAGEAASSATDAHYWADQAASSAGAATAGGIRYDTAQSLTDPQKAQAQSNLGVEALQGNLGFAGTGRRIKGDFGNNVHANRVLVENSTPNASTLFGLIPSGTGNISRYYAYNGSDPDNAAFAQFAALASEARFTSGKQGTASYLPLTVWVNNGEVSRWTTSGNFLIGTSTDDGVHKLQVNGSVAATSFAGSGADLTGFTLGQITTALGFTPYSAANPSGYISGITGSMVTTALGYTPYSAANPNAYISGITDSMVTTALGYTPENAAHRNAVNGYAGLDSSGLIPSSLLPSFVDDVLEYANLASFPGTGESWKIYVAIDTGKTYRWSGSVYVEISASPGSTDSLTEGSVNLYFTQARARAAISATGSLSYNASTGIVSYTAPTALSAFTNDSGFITASALSPYLTTASAASTYLPMAGGSLSGNLDFSGANRRITGDFTSTSRVLVQTTSANSNTVFGLIPSGTAVNSQFHVWGASDITNAPLGAFTINSSSVQIQSSAAGTGTVLPFRVLVGTTETFRVTTGYNFLIGSSADNGTDKLQVNGTIKSLTGGYVFPDGTTQTTAAVAGVTTGKAIAMALVFGG